MGRVETPRIAFKQFQIWFDEETNLWKSTDANEKEISTDSLKSLKARLTASTRQKIKSVKAYYKFGYKEKVAMVEITAINEKGYVFYRDPQNHKQRAWDLEKFSAVTPENTALVETINQKWTEVARFTKEAEALERKLKPIKKGDIK